MYRNVGHFVLGGSRLQKDYREGEERDLDHDYISIMLVQQQIIGNIADLEKTYFWKGRRKEMMRFLSLSRIFRKEFSKYQISKVLLFSVLPPKFN